MATQTPDPTPSEPIDTANDFLVGRLGDDLAFTIAPTRITKPEALRLAAWLVVLADPLDEHWPAVKDAVRNT